MSIPRTPTLNWINRPAAYWEADLGDGTTLRIFSVHRVGFELWRWKRPDDGCTDQEYLNWFPTLKEAQAYARTWVGDDE